MRAVLSVAVMAMMPGAAGAQSTTPNTASATTSEAQLRLDRRADEVAAVLMGTRQPDQTFAPGFLAQVKPEQLAAIHAQFVAAYGPLRADSSIDAKGEFEGEIALRYERAIVRGPLVLSTETPYLVTGLRIASTDPVGDSKPTFEKDIAALPGQVNAYLAPLGGGRPVIAVGADRPFALGSTFKLYVLSALHRAVTKGERRWDEVVPLSVKSYPSGLSQEWPQGSPVTLQTLATLMLQISDNTATDQLITLLGRDAIEAEFRATSRDTAPSLPFLTTREMFAIKADPALRARYAAATEAQRRTMLTALPREGPPLEQVAEAFGGSPLAVDRIEWFGSPQSLAALLQRLTGPDAATARGILAASKGMSPELAARWNYVGFKGGSEPGVLNFTWLLQDTAGAWHIATLGWNNPVAPVDQAALNALAMRMLALTP